MDFKRAGKTLVITTQGMDLIERLCDRVILLDHGKILFQGRPVEAINRYCSLLNTDKFYVGSIENSMELVENTKKWVDEDSRSLWGKEIGTKEAVIESVEFIDKFERYSNQIRTKDALKIKAYFTVRDDIKEPHFGVAIFRADGVYCYGPNTLNDEYYIPGMKRGKGFFELNYHKLLLAPGEYLVSLAIWDKNETLAFDHHNGCYRLIVKGRSNRQKELLNIRYRINSLGFITRLVYLFKKKYKHQPDLSLLNDAWNNRLDVKGFDVRSVKMFNSKGEEKNIFMTNEAVKLVIDFINLKGKHKNACLWVGIYRDDGVYCQGINVPLTGNTLNISFPELSLLPGSYKISFGIWDIQKRCFLMYHHAVYPFKMVFNKQDHGTVYLKHKWGWCHAKS